jgi:hypothetical protein
MLGPSNSMRKQTLEQVHACKCALPCAHQLRLSMLAGGATAVAGASKHSLDSTRGMVRGSSSAAHNC